MFTTIMYGFINEVTRQPASAGLTTAARQRGSMASARRRIRRATRPTVPTQPLSGQQQILADTFKRAAGFIN